VGVLPVQSVTPSGSQTSGVSEPLPGDIRHLPLRA
jgi:hypothetical protein